VVRDHGSRRRRSTKTSVDQVYSRTRAAILSGEYAPGTPLRLQELADANAVSLIPVREALRLLESEKLVESIPNKGARVAPLSTDDVRSAYEARIILEVEALGRAYDHLTEDDLSAARELANEMVEQFRRGNDVAGYDLHRRLHFSLYEPFRSKWILHFISLMWDHTERYRRMATEIRRDPDGIGHEHLAVLEALERGDKGDAQAALKAHLEHTAKILIDAWTADEAEQEA
jgi:DNA-binding GntR family transcriptional regulator